MPILKIGVVVIPMLISVAFITLLERKVLSMVGSRLGPNKVSIMGFLQPLGDAAKLSQKQRLMNTNTSLIFYVASSSMMFMGSCLLLIIANPSTSTYLLKFSMIMFLLVLSFNCLSSVMAGWSSHSKYSLMGSIRTVSQMISYEAVLFLCILLVIFLFSSFSFNQIKMLDSWNLFILLPVVFYPWCMSVLAELNRTPYDFSEGESELVSGFNLEFGSLGFTLIFLSEYLNIVIMSIVTALVFFGVLSFYAALALATLVLWIRSVLPRLRFDKLMLVSWKTLVPSITAIFLLYSIISQC